MTSGQSALSLTDIPFVYSLANILMISLTGSFELERFALTGIIAGIFGTFLVFWHPVQWIIDKVILSTSAKGKEYFIEQKNSVPPSYDVKITKSLIRLSLNTYAIKYQKDKFVSLIYFMIILGAFSVGFDPENFKNIISISDDIANMIKIFPFFMMIGLGYFLYTHGRNLLKNLKLSSLYFFMTKSIIGYGNESSLIKSAIDLNDWATAKETIDGQLLRHWTALKNFSK